MTKRLVIPLFASILCLMGCHKDSPARKIVDGLPVATNPPPVVPAQAIQQYILLKNTAVNIAITNLNRLSLPDYPPQGLTGPNGSLEYTRQVSESHFKSATFTLQFRDGSNSPIDPFTTRSATTTVQSVHITITGSSDQFPSYSEDLTVSLGLIGILTGPYTMLGNSIFTGSSYSINFTIPAAVAATVSGLINGNASFTGTGPNGAPTSGAMVFGQSSDISGTLKWDDQTAGIHVDSTGAGYLTTETQRELFQ